uniref:Uncharacterized protein n=1 Tax=Arundo donax TaxID=35708 RepID=A0A0A9CZS4_ARUDO
MQVLFGDQMLRSKHQNSEPQLYNFTTEKVVYTELKYTWMFMQCIPPLTKPDVSALAMTTKLTGPKWQKKMLQDYGQIICTASHMYRNGKEDFILQFNVLRDRRGEPGGGGEAKGWRRPVRQE